MKRTQIYLTIEQWQELQVQSKNKHKTIAELIRHAVDKVYRQKKITDSEQAIKSISGLWADRTDLGSTDEYIRELRKGRRLEEFGFDK